MSEQQGKLEVPETPPLVKYVTWAWHHIRENGEVLFKPPVVIALVIIGWVAFSYGSGRKEEELNVRNERIAFLTDQLAAYRDRLQGATPDQAAKEITALRHRLEVADQKIQLFFPDAPRHLNQRQKEVLVSKKDELLAFKSPIVVYAWYLGDSVGFASDFLRLFNEEKIQAIGPVTTICEQSQRGVLIGLANHQEKPSENAARFMEILKAAELNRSYTKWEGTVSPPALDFDLFICP
jgi:hypothetical protein